MIGDDARARADWPYLRWGGPTLFRRRDLFEAARAALETLDYRIVAVDAASVEAVTVALSRELDWSGQFGYSPWTGNLDALDEGVAGAPFPDSACLAFCFDGFERVAAEDAAFARGLLDVFTGQARGHLVEGRRMLVLVRTDDPDFHADGLGAAAAMWNAAEFFRASRRGDG
ncbi:MAG: hypothetical protein QM608_22745 [Caulobacter sp.]